LPTLLSERRGKSDAEDEAFSNFLLPMLELMPEQRATAYMALEHPFLEENGVTNKAAKAVQKVRLSFVGEVLHTMQDLRKDIAQFVATDQFLQKPRKRKSSKVVEATGFGEVTGAENLTNESVQIVEDLRPAGEISAGVAFGARGAGKRLKVRLSIEKPLDVVRVNSKMTLLSEADGQRKKLQMKRKLLLMMEDKEVEKSSRRQFKKTKRNEEDQGSDYQDTDCNQMKSPKKKRKASKEARLNLKKAVKKSLAQESRALSKQNASRTGSRVQKFDSKAVAEEPLMDQILVEVLDRVAVKRLVTGKALVDYVSRYHPEFGAKEVWIGKLKAALGMEVARGNLILVRNFWQISHW
jgi:hypothetical protein